MLTSMPDVTTIKVPQALRHRISMGASRRGITAAALVGELVDRYEREQRLAAVGRSYDAAQDVGYGEETAAWDDVVADGLAE